MPPSHQVATQADLAVLHERFNGIERILEKVSDAMDKMADNRERTIVLETRINHLEGNVTDLQKAVGKAGEERSTMKTEVAVMMAKGSIAMALVAIAIPVGVTYLLEKLF